MTGVGKWRYTPATLTRWVSSINQFHTAAGLDAPGRAEVVRRALSGIRRIRSTPPVRRSPLLLDDIRTLLQPMIESAAGSWPAGVGARRDAALLLMGFAGAHRRSELVALTLADVTLHKADGLHVRIRSVQDRPGSPRPGQGPALRPGPGDLPALRLRPVATSAARLGHRRPTAPSGAQVLTVLRRQSRGHHRRMATSPEVQHCCRTARLPEPVDPGRALFPTIHRGRRHRHRGDDRAGGRRDDPTPRRPRPGSPRRRSPSSAGTFTPVGVRHRGLPGRRRRARDHAADRAPLTRDARGLRPGTRPADGQRRHPPSVSDMTTAATTARRNAGAGDRAGRTRGTGPLFTDWCAVNDARSAARGAGHGHRVPDRLPVRTGHPTPPGRRDRPPPRRRRTGQPGGVDRGPHPARPTHRRHLRGFTGHDRRGRGSAPRVAVAGLDAGDVRPAGPLPAGAVPTGRGAVQTPGHDDRRRHRLHRRRRHHHLPGRSVVTSPGQTTPCCAGRARSPAGYGSSTWRSPRSAPVP